MDAVWFAVWHECVGTRELVSCVSEQLAVRINFRISRKNYGLMTTEIKLFQNRFSNLFVEPCQRRVHNERRNQSGQAAERLVKSKHPHLALPRGRVRLFPRN